MTATDSFHQVRRLCLATAALLALATPLATPAAAPTDAALPPLDAATYRRAEAVLPQNLGALIRQPWLQPQWIGDGPMFWFEKRTRDGYAYLLVDPVAGTQRSLFDIDRLKKTLIARGATIAKDRPFRPGNLRYDANASTLAFDIDGEAWSYDLKSASLTRTETAAADGEKRTTSPDGAWQVAVRDHDLYLIATADGRERRLTRDGSRDAPYARPVVDLKTMIAAGDDNPDLAPDIVWSPDSSRFATYRMRYGKSRTLAVVQSSPPGDPYPRVFSYRYPLTGDKALPVAEEYVFDVDSGQRRALEIPAEPMLYYGSPGYQWSRDGRQLFRSMPDRGYGALTLFRIDPATGKATVLIRDTAAPYIDYYGHYWEYDGETGTHYWQSEANGYAQLHALDGASGKRHAVTRGRWHVRRIAGYDRKNRAVFVVGNGREADRDPYYATLYRIPSAGGTPLLLTPEPYDHDVWVSPDGRYFVDNMSKIDAPTVSLLRSARDGRVLTTLAQADVSDYIAAGYTLPEPFEARAADGRTRLYGALYRPADFDPGKRYPVVEYVYTGPHTFNTPKTFNSAMFRRNANAIAQLGFFVVMVDGRGTAYRSRAFKLPAYRNLHAVGLDDHIAAIRGVAKRYPQMDLERVGVYGFSAGGYDVVRAMTERPDFYRAGVAASGNHDNRLDKAQWNEQWMGAEPGPVFDDNSNARWAEKLQGKLLLAHGELDENVPTAATMRLVDALIAANKDFEFLIVPNADHILDDSPYFNRRRWDFLVRALQGREPPENYRIAPFVR